MTALTLPTCTKCGAPMPAARLDEVHVTCSYCGKVDVAPPPPPSAWLAQHHELVAPSIKAATVANKISAWGVGLYVAFIGSIIVIGLIAMAVRALI